MPRQLDTWENSPWERLNGRMGNPRAGRVVEEKTKVFPCLESTPITST